MSSSPLHPAQLRSAAQAQFGLHDFGDPDLYQPALEALTASIAGEARLSPERTFRTAMQLVMLLGARARLQPALDELGADELGAVELVPPIFIVGLPRTGSTLLHNLLSGHPELRAPALWEMRAPSSRRGSPEESSAIAETRNMLGLLSEMAPEFSAIHPLDATRPDECSWLFRHSFASLVYAFQYYVPGYAQWLTSCDMVPHYSYYRRLLQLLQKHRPMQGDQVRWVLKDPCHLWHLDALLTVFPGATVVVLHRDLQEAMPSMASLCFSLQRMDSQRTDPAALSAYCLDLAERGLFGMMRYRRVFRQANITDVSYERLVTSPRATLEQICASAGLRHDEEALKATQTWLDEHPQHRAGRHHYSLEKFGFTHAALRARLGRYQEEHVPESPLREA